MAIIGKIRNQSWLLLTIIGLGILLFILDPSALQTLFGGQQAPKVGKLGDVEVDAQELEKRTQYWIDIYASGYNQRITAEQARNIAWQDLVKQEVLLKDISTVGLRFAEEEFDDMRFGEGVIGEFTNNFKDENGNFDPERVKQSYSFLYNQNRPIWEAEYKRLKESRLTEKYNTLLSKTLYANSLEAKDAYVNKNSSVSFRYVSKTFSEIPDSTVTVSDSDLSTYFNAHKNEVRYTQKAGRDLDLLVFPVKATDEDVQAIKGEASKILSDFSSATNDSLYVVQNSDNRSYAKNGYTRADMDSTVAEAVFTANIDEAVGPFRSGEAFILYKVVGDDAKAEATVRHLLLTSNASNDAEVKQRADSMLNAIKRGADFEKLVERFTEDPGSKSTGGKYEWFPKGQMVPEFEDFSFNKPIGTRGVVKTNYGYHVMENLDRRSEPMRQVVELRKDIVPSTSTYDAAYEAANAFLIDHSDAASFKAGAEEAGLEIKSAKGVAAGSASIAGLANAQEIVRWAYSSDRSVGNVSDPKEAGDNFVLALLTGSKEDGVPRMEDIKALVRTEVLKEKKAKMIKEQLGSYASVDEAAGKLSKTATSAQNITMSNPNITGAGREPIVVGNAMARNEGEVLSPIVGQNGVFVIEVTGKAEANTETVDLSGDKNTIRTSLRGQVGQMNTALNDFKGVKNDLARYY